MKIKEIDDSKFREAIAISLTRKDKPRRFEIHFSDLPYSLILAWRRKIFVQKPDFSRERFKRTASWMRGIGHEIGYVNILKRFHTQYQRRTVCGSAVGSIDLVLFDIIYELTTTVAFPEWRSTPYIGKAQQLIYYLASEGKKKGRVKIFMVLGERRDAKKRKGKRQYRRERTWEITLKNRDIKRVRKIIERKSNILKKALETGDWTILPKSPYSWMRVEEDKAVKWLKAHPKKTRRAWKLWKKDKRAVSKAKSKKPKFIVVWENAFEEFQALRAQLSEEDNSTYSDQDIVKILLRNFEVN